MVVEVVADLGRDDHLVAHPAEGVGEERLPKPRAVGVGGVEVVNPLLEGASQEAHRPMVVYLAPPAGRDRPHAEADLGDAYVCAGQIPIPHLEFLALVFAPQLTTKNYYILSLLAVGFLSTRSEERRVGKEC